MDSEQIRDLNLRIIRLQNAAECSVDPLELEYLAKLIAGLERERERIFRE